MNNDREKIYKLTATCTAIAVVALMVFGLITPFVITSCSMGSNVVSGDSEISEVSEVPKDITNGIVFDKYDYIAHNHYDTSEVYMIGFRGNNEDGVACERYVRVTSVTYQSLNIGDKFDMNEHERK